MRVESNQVRVVSDQVLAQPIVPGKSIDCIGFFCPIPIVKTREALRTMAGAVYRFLVRKVR